VDEHIFAAVITDDKTKALLGIEKLHNAGGAADDEAGAGIARGTRAAEAAATTATKAAAEATATATAEAATTAAAEAITTATEAIPATAEAITAAKAGLKLVKSALALVEPTTPGPTPAFIKAHVRSRSFIIVYGSMGAVGCDAIRLGVETEIAPQM
jgi:hypothetical protein